MVNKSKFSCVKIKYLSSVLFSLQFIDELEEVIENSWISFLSNRTLECMLPVTSTTMPCSLSITVPIRLSIIQKCLSCTSRISLTQISFSIVVFFFLSFRPSFPSSSPVSLEIQRLSVTNHFMSSNFFFSKYSSFLCVPNDFWPSLEDGFFYSFFSWWVSNPHLTHTAQYSRWQRSVHCFSLILHCWLYHLFSQKSRVSIIYVCIIYLSIIFFTLLEKNLSPGCN